MDVCLRETTIEIPTQRILAPSVNPAIFGKHFHPFPYTMQNHLDEALVPVKWRAIELENEYLKLAVLPDMGGRVALFYDKLAGRDIFTPVREVKPRMIAHRGAWAAGGLEFNFPISHSPTTMDTVNTATRRYPDGSASVVLGGIERLSHMGWQVELRLTPGKACLEQIVRLANPTDNFQRFYFWSNAALPYVRGMRMTYPFDWRTTMDGRYEKWPMDGAMDSSDPAMIPFSYETFGKLLGGNFFGVHYPRWDFGVAHTAPRKQVKGAKFFHWGNCELAGAWNRALLPEGQEYIEIQSGPFESQAVFRHMAPGAVLGWTEYWYGTRGIGPAAAASPDCALALERLPGGVCVKVSANSRHEEALVRVTCAGMAQEQLVSLSPDSPLALEFTGVGPEDKVAVDIYAGGSLLLAHGHGAEPMPEAPDTDLFEDCRTFRPAEELEGKPLAQGMDHEQWGRLAEAAEAYEEALCQNPDCTTALTRLGRIHLTRRRAVEAADCFERALRYDNRCGAARFGLAAAYCRLGDLEQARRLYYDIPCDDPLFEASMLEAAALNIRLADPWDNLSLLEGTQNPKGLFLLQVSRRLAGLCPIPGGAPQALPEYLLAEQFLAGQGGEGFLALTGGREDQLVTVALTYAALGLADDCVSLLSLVRGPGMKTALLRARCGASSVCHALSMPMDGVFVNEPDLLDLLESCEDGTGKSAWLLGCFEYSAGLTAEALDHWLEAYGKGLRHTALLYCLGQAHWRQGDGCEALRFLREDASLHGSANAESLALLFDILKEQGDIFQRLELLPLLQQAANRPAVLVQMVESLRDGGLFEEAVELMETAQFQCWENGEVAGPLWSSVIGAFALKLAQEGRAGEAKLIASRMFNYPDGLYYGRSPTRSQAEHWLALGRVYRLTGEPERAYEAFRTGAAEGAVPSIRRNGEAMEWVRMCMEEMRKV